MPDGRIVVEMSGDEAKLYASIMQATRGFNKMGDGIGEVGKKAKQAAKEEADMAREGARIWEQTRTPMEQYRARLQRLNELMHEGFISTMAHDRAIKQLGEDFGHTGTKGTKAFADLGQTIVHTVAALAGVAGPLALIQGMLDKLGEARREAAQEARDAEMGIGSLKQLTTNQQEYDELLKGAGEIETGAGVSKEESGRIAFALKSAGLFDQRKTFIDLRANAIVGDIAGLARSADTMITSMGADQVGTARQVISKGMAAGTIAPTLMEEILPAAARAGVSAKSAGITDKELLTATALLAKASGESGRASTQMKALSKGLAMAQAFAARPEAPAYSEEEFLRDKQALDAERETAKASVHQTAREDPLYRQQMFHLDVQKARLSHQHGRTKNPVRQAELAQALRDIGDQEHRALADSERRAEHSPQYQGLERQFKLRDEALIKRRKAGGAGIATDEEGNIVDDERQKLLRAAGLAMAKAGPDMLSRLVAVQSMGLDEVQLRKLFGRQEGREAMGMIVGNAGQYQQGLAKVTRAEREDEIEKRLALKEPSSQRAVHAARIEKAKQVDSAEELGTVENVFEAARQRHYRMIRAGIAQGTILPGEYGIAIHKMATATIGEIPGRKKASLQAMYDAGGFDIDRLQPDLKRTDPAGYAREVELKGLVEHVLGIDKNRSPKGPGDQQVADAAKNMNDAAKNLNDAASSLKDTGRKRPTLAPPNARN
jgi:hypothetical protein